MKILDLSAGHRHIWFNTKHPLVTFLDRRPEVKPDIVCDTRHLPAEVGSGFDLIVFDPPHENCGPNGNMARNYGHSTRADIYDTIEGSAKEAYRVGKATTLMAFKWNDCGISLKKVIPLLEASGWEPLFGHGFPKSGRHKSETTWVMLMRRADELAGGGE